MAKAKKLSSARTARRGIRRKRRAPKVVSATAKTYGVDLRVAKKIDKAKFKIQRRSGLLVTTAIAIGHELITIKDLLLHGTFRTYVTNEFPFSFRLAEMWMNCAAIAQGNSDIIDRFQATALYKLAAPTTPVSVREHIFADVRAGQECPPLDEIKLQIEHARESKFPDRAINVSEFEPDLDFSLDAEALRKIRGFELSAAGSEFMSFFIANIPRNELGAAARLLGTLCYTDLAKMAAKIRFKTLRSEQLARPDAEIDANCAFGA
jgi:hypothetical protein